jgi:hypothetical protein
MTKLLTVLSRADLPLAELSAARLDGELYCVDDGYSPVDVPCGPYERAASIAEYCRGRLMAEQRTAAWVWGALDGPPARHELCASLGARARPAFPIRTVVREVVIDAAELVLIGGIGVTTPLRTIVDLARFSERFGDAERGIVERLASSYAITLDRCRTEMDSRTNLPNKRRALARLSTVPGFG